jgi:integration host factor subunit beta
MRKSELISALADRASLSNSRAKQAVAVVFDSMLDALATGDKVEIRGLFSIRTRSYDGYLGRNPKTGAAVQVAPKHGIVFKVGSELRDELKDETAPESEG